MRCLTTWVLSQKERRTELIKELHDTPDYQLKEKVQEVFETEFGIEGEDEKEEVGMVLERGRVAELRQMVRQSEGWGSVRAVAGSSSSSLIFLV